MRTKKINLFTIFTSLWNLKSGTILIYRKIQGSLFTGYCPSSWLKLQALSRVRCIQGLHVIAKTRKRGKRSAEVFAKPYNPRPIKISRRYETLEHCSEVEDEKSIYYIYIYINILHIYINIYINI